MFFVFSVIIVSKPPITPAESHRLFRVGNDEIFGRELALHAIQRLERFAGAGLCE